MTEPKERPIIFSAPMVRAILAGTKTMTRRFAYPSDAHLKWHEERSLWVMCGNWNEETQSFCDRWEKAGARFLPGDRLWVREPWRFIGWPRDETECRFRVQYRDGAKLWVNTENEEPDKLENYWAQCSDEANAAGLKTNESGISLPIEGKTWDESCPTRWRKAMFMPRWASRITMEITNVRVERVQEITIDDAKAEGIPEYENEFDPFHSYRSEAWDDMFRNRSTVGNFAWYWDEIHKKHPERQWDKNPWVWVVEFKKL